MTATKRKRDASSKGLNPGEMLQRTTHTTASTSWGWVLSEAKTVSEITNDHLLATCGMSALNTHRFCRNKYSPRLKEAPPNDEDIIVISDDDDDLQCSKRSCKTNPNCLNYIEGQKQWESEADAREMFLEVANLGRDPTEDDRKNGVPVGLKNLGATCYANASLQVWFRDLAFRRGVFDCEPPEGNFEKSPIFQLQITFAALQCIAQDVFNPEKLVEALELKTTEQQDAQEFSKLFLSHLDTEFQKQSNPVLKTLITDQFQGKRVYGIICSKCGNDSPKDSDFLEIEINFKNNTKLEDGISNSLREELMSGDNQYSCSTCGGLQDATRYTELASLPPVIHFSLQRFSYNLDTMERVKSKNVITFPQVLDMTPFLGKTADVSTKADSNIYELRGVLLHKGKSAYHGHYEAQIHDVTSSSWFQFNDEVVSRIKKLGDKPPAKEAIIDVDDDENRKKQRENKRKRQRIDDSDDERQTTLDAENRISSKDAYMLIYARRESCPSVQVPEPPSRALSAVDELNAAHQRACATYAAKEQETIAAYQRTRTQVLDIYRQWSVTANQKDFVIVGQKTLEEFLQTAVIKSTLAIDATEPQRLALDDVICVHGRYDPKKSLSMKRIGRDAYDKMKKLNCVIEPELTLEDVCRECVEETFHVKLYAKQHPQQVIEFDEVCQPVPLQVSYWISKPWLKDWRLNRPKMTTPTGDPSPGSDDYLGHVQCEHGGLALNTTQRCRISRRGVELLQTLYPSWKPLSDELESCLVCDSLVNMGAEERQQVRRRAEEEKARLKALYDDASSYQASLDDVSCALAPADFLQAWRAWVSRPSENLRPDRIDNKSFFCEHNLLAVDPNCEADWRGALAVIKKSDWDHLEQIYSGGPLIEIQKSQRSFTHPIPVCTGCRQRRQTEWLETEITIQSEQKEPTTGEKKAANFYGGPRQSTRLRLAKESTSRTKMKILKTTTIKDIKVHVQKELKIPTICQRLFYRDEELSDNSATAASINVLAHSILQLKQENEVYEISDSEEAPKKKRKTEEAAGFGGTLLGRTNATRSSSPPDEQLAPAVKICRICTLENGTDLLACDACETPFD
ncbi:hypothetical protein MIND_01014800 [Mycena indigotica]|uniref:Ubiquitinyl hydrolase 1 n=1 Tax=Mycena indigotica TaxID=2126181 RepID=A0A8H6S9D3_9AGAR|nr:uncharacterized protein MIND_01014800 [Mycena indigotica]KAF7294772.1 hypothetical protein MIND_01014800 [Mycena indigotica]